MEAQPVTPAWQRRSSAGARELREAAERLSFAAVATKAKPPNLDIALKNVEAAVTAIARYAEQQAAGLESGGEDSHAAEAGPWNLRTSANALEAAAAACAAARDTVRA